MPKCTWEEINEIIHNCKGTLQKAYTIESAAKKLRQEIGFELEKLNEIILKQKEGET